MARGLTSGFHSFSISFEGSRRNERDATQSTAAFLGTRHHDLPVTRDQLWEKLKDSLWFSELPFVTLAPVGKFLLSEEARKFVTVVLTGEGADELFLGYRGFFQQAIRDTREAAGKERRASAKVRRLRLEGTSGAVVHKLSLFAFHRSKRRQIAQARRKLVPPASAKPIINAVQEARIAGMPFDILCFLGDREEMAHSLEARLPFLDHELYEVARSIPVDFKMRDGVEKAILREAAATVLPDEIRLRRKSGFMVTSEPVDLFGADREAATRFRAYFTKEMFERAGIFSYRTYRLMCALAKLPASQRFRFFARVRTQSNKVLMYMLQTHLLHEMFVNCPRWGTSVGGSSDRIHSTDAFCGRPTS
jgi:asparagine synthase (glutamine-hydrolysing)